MCCRAVTVGRRDRGPAADLPRPGFRAMPVGGTLGAMDLLASRIRFVALVAVLFTAIVSIGLGAGWLVAGRAGPTAIPSWGLVVLAVLLLTGVVAGIDLVLRRMVLEPLEAMAEEARRVANGAYDRRVPEQGPTELRDLAGSINRMADALLEDRRKLAENVDSLQEVNRALTEARDELIQAEKLASVGRLATGLAHEIGNPLNSVLTYAEVGRRRGVSGEWLDGIEDEARRIDEILRGLLEFARPGDPVISPHELNPIVEETLGLLQSQRKLDSVEVETSLGEDLPSVWVSPIHLQQVLVNLLLNAVDALEGPEGEPGRQVVSVRTRRGTYRGPTGVRNRVRRRGDPEEVDYSHLRRFHRDHSPAVDHPLEAGDPVVAVEVLDTGPGLEADSPERVFDPFYTTKEPGRGTGLGLAVSARLVSRMGGTISAEDRSDGPGACFRVILSTRKPPEMSEESREEGPSDEEDEA